LTACFKLMKTLQPGKKQQTGFPCEPCVYFSRNLDPSYAASTGGHSNYSCGLDFNPGDDKCIEMRTNNCSARKR
jgi:hypothetical protein